MLLSYIVAPSIQSNYKEARSAFMPIGPPSPCSTNSIGPLL